MRTIISTGQGRLHLFESALAIKKTGVNVKIITGWVPSIYIPNQLINLFGVLVKRKNITIGLRKRKPFGLKETEIKTCSFSEFLMHFLLIMSRIKLFKSEWAENFGWKIFGMQSKKYIKNADIFHVRTAAGSSGAIKKAKNFGMVVLADQSAAHPQEIYTQLSKAYKNKPIPFDPNNGLWKLVLADCVNADYILVNSDYVKKSFVENGFDDSIIFVIPLGIRQDFMNLKVNYKIKEKIKLLYTGSFRTWKGSLLIIDAVKQLIDNNIDFHIDIIGSVSDESNIPEWFLCHTDVKLHGHMAQDELKIFFANSDIYIFPSYCDGGAQSQKEAMAAGLPVISSTKSGSPIVHGENGWIIQDDSSQELFDAIISLAADEELRKMIGRNAALTISRHHTWERYGDEVSRLYTSLLNARVC